MKKHQTIYLLPIEFRSYQKKRKIDSNCTNNRYNYYNPAISYKMAGLLKLLIISNTNELVMVKPELLRVVAFDVGLKFNPESYNEMKEKGFRLEF